ncbi:MAG: thioredoxin 2 [Desulfobacteraceae bacterium Eth-SRB2]|nr:MAG: thioredoxin 2 [Desulfobacteraceae bacterium Eth-SRB2]
MNPDSIIIRCKSCGTKNRIPKNRLNDSPVCGRCHTPLSKEKIYDYPVDITDQTFKDEVISYPGPVLVDCWAPWCGPCQMITPVLEQLAREYAGRIKIAKLNADENPVTASQFAVQSIPTILVFKNGKNVNRLVGALPKNEIEKNILSIID